jgi:hypothetical protein
LILGDLLSRLLAAIAAALLLLLGTTSVAHAAPGDLTITLPGGDQGDDLTPRVEGTADPAYPVHVLVDGAEVAVITPAADGSWGHQLTTPLTAGQQAELRAQVLDPQDPTQVLAEQVVYYSAWEPLPRITISQPTAGAVIGQSFTVRAHVEGNQAYLFEVLLDGQVIDNGVGFEDAETLFSTPFVDDLTDGPHTLQIRGRDERGRVALSDEVAVVGDVTPPPAPVITSPAQGAVVSSRTVTIAGTATPGATVEIIGFRSGEPTCTDRSVVADASGHWSCQVRPEIIDFLQGQRVTFETVAFTTDEVGNRAFSAERAFVLDYTVQAQPTPPPSTPSTPADDPASAVPADAAAPELANTGASTFPGLGTALLLVTAGLALTTVSRRLS